MIIDEIERKNIICKIQQQMFNILNIRDLLLIRNINFYRIIKEEINLFLVQIDYNKTPKNIEFLFREINQYLPISIKIFYEEIEIK